MRRVAPHGHCYGEVRDRDSIRISIHRNRPFRKTRKVVRGNKRDKEHLMLDVVMLALGLGFFAVAIGYTYACERL